MNDHAAWLLHGKPVIIAEDACMSPRFHPSGEYGLYVKMALDKLSTNSRFRPAGVVTVDELSWPIKAIVEENDNRQPVWAAHAFHECVGEESTHMVSPFVFMHRDARPPMTKSLTLAFRGTKKRPVIQAIYAGPAHPPLPWQLSATTSNDLWEKSMSYWRTHSFVYDRSLITTALSDEAPSWYVPVLTPQM